MTPSSGWDIEKILDVPLVTVGYFHRVVGPGCAHGVCRRVFVRDFLGAFFLPFGPRFYGNASDCEGGVEISDVAKPRPVMLDLIPIRPRLTLVVRKRKYEVDLVHISRPCRTDMSGVIRGVRGSGHPLLVTEGTCSGGGSQDVVEGYESPRAKPVVAPFGVSELCTKLLSTSPSGEC